MYHFFQFDPKVNFATNVLQALCLPYAPLLISRQEDEKFYVDDGHGLAVGSTRSINKSKVFVDSSVSIIPEKPLIVGATYLLDWPGWEMLEVLDDSCIIRHGIQKLTVITKQSGYRDIYPSGYINGVELKQIHSAFVVNDEVNFLSSAYDGGVYNFSNTGFRRYANNFSEEGVYHELRNSQKRKAPLDTFYHLVVPQVYEKYIDDIPNPIYVGSAIIHYGYLLMLEPTDYRALSGPAVRGGWSSYTRQGSRSIEGIAYERGLPAPAKEVWLYSSAYGEKLRMAVSDEQGRYVFDNLTPEKSYFIVGSDNIEVSIEEK